MGPSAGQMPVIIAGAGPTGLTLALLLSRLRIPSLLVDRAAGLTTHPQASCLLKSSIFAAALSFKQDLQPKQCRDAHYGVTT